MGIIKGAVLLSIIAGNLQQAWLTQQAGDALMQLRGGHVAVASQVHRPQEICLPSPQHGIDYCIHIQE